MARESRSSSHHRMWLAALLPATVLTLVLSGLHWRERAAVAEAQALEHASALARQFAALVAPEVQRADHSRLRATARAVTRHYATVRQVTITDHQGQLLARAGDPASLPTPPALRRIEHPIAAGTGLKPLGQLSIDVDLSALPSGQPIQRWVTASAAGLVLLGVLGACVLARGRNSGNSTSGRQTFGAGWPASARRQSGAEPMPDGPDRDEQAATLARLREDNQRLERARREAEAAAQRKSRYLADIGHEIRTPMNAILGFTELMATDQRRAKQADYAATIRDSIRGLLGLLNGVLDVSKAEAGRLELDYSDVDVEAVLDEMFRLFAPQAFAKGVEVIAAPDSAIPVVRADAVRLKQILVNLLSNAIRFTEAGHIRLRAEAIGEATTHVRLCFAVEDTGCGIPESDQPRLFDAFMQGEQADNAPRGPALDPGTGLGLSIASELAGLMGGRLAFASEEGRGSTFWLTLDLERASASKSTDARVTEVDRRVALIDPDPMTREPHVQFLKRAGIAAEVMDATAWRTVSDPDRYDAILVHIPAHSAAEGPIAPPAPELEQATMPLIALVYEQDSSLQERLWRSGYRRVLGKTTNPQALREGLEAALVAEPIAPSGDLAQSPPTNYRVLVVDDHPVNLRLMRQFLADEAIAVATAATGEEAQERAAREPFDAIVLDLRLPDRDGCETARWLRAQPGPNARAPIIAVTADCPAAEAEDALSAGCDDVLGKPVSQEALLDRLRAWIPALAPEQGASEVPVIDHERALERARNKPALADELLATLCRTLPASRRAFTLARLRGDCEALRAEAHRLRGAVVYCSVPRLEAALGELDEALHSGEEIRLTRAVHRLEREITTVLAQAQDRKRIESPRP